jgi:hypothetical protein
MLETADIVETMGEELMRGRRLGVILVGLFCTGVLATAGCGETKIIVVPGVEFSAERVAAQDAAAKSLVRNAMTCLESAYVDLRTVDPGQMTPEVLSTIEPSIVFKVAGSVDAAAKSPESEAARDEVDYCGEQMKYAVGCRSESGKTFGMTVDKGPGGGNTFYVDGSAGDWASTYSGSAAAQDANAKSLVRNAMTCLESAYVDLRTFDPGQMTPEVLSTIEPSIVFKVAGSVDAAATIPESEAARDEVDYCGDQIKYSVGCRSESGKTFGVIVDKGPGGGNSYYVDGRESDW